MNRSKFNQFLHTTFGKYIEASANELEIDAVALSFVVYNLRRAFDLDGDDLDEAVREVLTRMIVGRDGRPIQGCSDDGGYWSRVTRFGDDPEKIVEDVIREWHESGKDPEIGDIWFASPEFIATECRAKVAVRDPGCAGAHRHPALSR